MGSVGGVGLLAVLFLGGLRVMQGTFSLGDFVAFTTTLAMLTWPSIALGWILNSFQRGMAAMDRLEELLAEPLEPPGVLPAATGGGAIEARDLRFQYPGADRPALDGVTFSLAPPGRLGVVGPPGAGKSTLVDLLLGLRLPPRGTLLIDGTDVLDLDLPAWRRRCGVVPQGAFAFSTTLRENAGYALPEGAGTAAGDAAVDEAVQAAALGKDLPALAARLDTLVGERGVTLSGGQRQRLALARALAVGPELLVLDDALSAVDAETEHEILARLAERRAGGRMAEVRVSHRLSVVADCDEILVLDAGRVVERGTHAALLATGGAYARAWREQELRRELSGVP
jgi:ATP-binding cassette subfamily B protein